MRCLACSLLTLALVGCATQAPTTARFAEPNALMGEEIRSRIAEIPFQHREELYLNLVWLSQRGEHAIPSLIEALHHAEPKVRSNASWVLGQIGDRRVIPDLQPLAEDRDRTVRLEVARTLLVLGDMRYAPELIGALDSDKPQVRYLCHEALKQATGQDFGYDHLSDDGRNRQLAVLAWREWWGGMSGDEGFATQYAAAHNLDAEPADPWAGQIDPADPLATPATPNPAPMTEIAPQPQADIQPQSEAQPQVQTQPVETAPQPQATAPETAQPQRPVRPDPLATPPQPEATQPAQTQATTDPAPPQAALTAPQQQMEAPQTQPAPEVQPVQPETTTPEAVQPEAVQPQATQPQTQQPQPQPTQTQPAQPQATQPPAAQPQAEPESHAVFEFEWSEPAKPSSTPAPNSPGQNKGS